jgi:hypothetical protein
MLNVQDECDLPEDDGYDLFTRETEVERRRWDELPFGTKRPVGGDRQWPSFSATPYRAR